MSNRKKVKPPKWTPVYDSPSDRFGVYVAYVIDEEGKEAWIADKERNVLSIEGEYGDQERIQILKKTAASFGFKEARAKFLPGRRQVSEEEYRAQHERMAAGLVPDERDLSWAYDAIRDENKGKNWK